MKIPSAHGRGFSRSQADPRPARLGLANPLRRLVDSASPHASRSAPPGATGRFSSRFTHSTREGTRPRHDPDLAPQLARRRLRRRGQPQAARRSAASASWAAPSAARRSSPSASWSRRSAWPSASPSRPGSRTLPVHRSMLEISELIYETAKTYLMTQFKFIADPLGLHRRHHRPLLRRALRGLRAGQGGHHPGLLAGRHPRLVRRGLVRHPGQHLRQQPHRLRRRCAASPSRPTPSRCRPACRSARCSSASSC